MLEVKNVSLKFGTRTLFKDVNLKFLDGECYGLIGANGAGKSTFLKILTGEIDTTTGSVIIEKGKRISFLKQDHYMYDEVTVINTVLMGNKKLWDIIEEKNKLYSQTEFSDDDYNRMAELEGEFMDLDGWNQESNAATLLNNLGIDVKYHNELMKDIPVKLRIKVLLAQALFDDPDILLLDEPTNSLDSKAISWLEEFLINFKNTVIVVSHDRHFLNKVCTSMVDIDYGKIKLFFGNYDFWYESSQLLLKQIKQENKKKEDKIKELQEFIRRFSANASKSKQATSRKKILESIEIEKLEPSSRKYPFIEFKIENPHGKEILTVGKLTKKQGDKILLDKISFNVQQGDKIAIISDDDNKKTALFNILMGIDKEYNGEVIWGKTMKPAYMPQDNTALFEKGNLNIMEWIGDEYDVKDEQVLRGFLGRMLFTSDDVFKKVGVLSGGEKQRCVLSRMMLFEPNFLVLDEPTNHLDLESITSLNKGLERFTGEIIFTSRDHELNSTVANRIIYIDENGKIKDRYITYDEFMDLGDE